MIGFGLPRRPFGVLEDCLECLAGVILVASSESMVVRDDTDSLSV